MVVRCVRPRSWVVKTPSVNMQGRTFGSALQATSYGSHENIIRLQLANEAEEIMQGGGYGGVIPGPRDHCSLATRKRGRGEHGGRRLAVRYRRRHKGH